MNRSFPLFLLASVFAAPAVAQVDDAPLPYDPLPADDSTHGRRKLPPRSEYVEDPPEETDLEKQERLRPLASLDDPYLGLAFQLVGGLMLQESARGAWVEPRLAYGARFTWEFGRRLFSDEVMREALFADVFWSSTSVREGTESIFAEAHQHYFSLAPAWSFPLIGRTLQLYLQGGGGVGYQFSTLHVADRPQQIAGVKPLFQYGLGFRGQAALNSQQTLQLAFRLELTRFRRGYMDDSLLAGSVGLLF